MSANRWIGSRLSAFRQHWRRDPTFVIAAGVLVLLIALAIIGPFFLVSPDRQNLVQRLQSPSPHHLLGTDDYGRDVLSRVVTAGRLSLGLGAAITGVAVGVGTLIGLISGYYARVAVVTMRVMDALMAFPVIVLAIALAVALAAEPGQVSEMIAITVTMTPLVARVVRSRTLVLAQRGYVVAARASGVRGWKILWRHVLPNAIPVILVQATFVYATALLADAALSFLGLGVAPPTPTWGNMIAEAKPYITTNPVFIIGPGAAIILAVMALNLTGDGFRAIVDPRAKAVLDLQALGQAGRRKRWRRDRRSAR